jgi:hypothetical protein
VRVSAADLTPEEIAAALAARRELGPEYEDAIAASLADRVEREIAARVSAASFPPEGRREAERAYGRPARDGGGSRAIGIMSLIMGIPVTAIVAPKGVASIAVAWGGIALVNMAHAFGRRRN